MRYWLCKYSYIVSWTNEQISITINVNDSVGSYLYGNVY